MGIGLGMRGVMGVGRIEIGGNGCWSCREVVRVEQRSGFDVMLL